MSEICFDCDGEGYVDHECGEDTCCCADPMPNVLCETCEGQGVILTKEELIGEVQKMSKEMKELYGGSR